MDHRIPHMGIDPSTNALSIFDLLPDAWLILDRQAQVVTANAAYLQLVDTTLPEIAGRSIYAINQHGTEGERAQRRDWLINTLSGIGPGETRVSPTLRYDLAARAGASGPAARFWQISASGVRTQPEGDILIALRVNDVTESVDAAERSQRERAKLRSQARLRQVLMEETNVQLRHNQEQLRLALAFAQIGSWELSPDTARIDCSEQCRSCLGLAPGTRLTVRHFFNHVVDAEDRPRVRGIVFRALRRREHFETDFRVVTASGSVHWTLMRGAGRYLPDGTLRTVFGFTLDITPRKEAELEQRAIAQSEKQARVQSEQMARAMDHFVTAVSHELRSPLSAILSWSTLLQRAADMSHLQRASTVIERNARQLENMVNDLLDSGAIATGKLSVEVRPVDLGSLVGLVAEDMRMNAEARGIALIAEQLFPCQVLADESRVRQIVWNLLSNAVKFCEAGTIEVSVIQRGNQAELTVRDSGSGIEQDALARIFERFEQASTTGSGRVAGLGLGLWLVKHLVELHGGKVTAESEGRGRGATFRVSLPIYSSAFA
ncbi:ATP-binding protein [Paraburkholderia sp. J76]|uniref:sensor histidine kinase n=1 Tax=Paraburkholderia sp. J76 TaxID=2805439 RepID=UPI002ABD80D8|nr:ATP-binding protein [Paraburkholderia sp. J76]